MRYFVVVFVFLFTAVAYGNEVGSTLLSADPITITDQINTITYKYSPRYAARMTFSPTGLGGWIVTSILFGDTQFAMEFE